MARKSASSSDSLDMLLDTMCNAFGGIVIIAILVALLLRQSGKQPEPGNARDEAIAKGQLPLTEAEIKIAQTELEKLKKQVSAKGVVAELIKKLNEQIAEKRRLEGIKSALEVKGVEKTATARGLIGTLESAIAKTGRDKGEMEAKTAAIAKEVLELKALIEQLKQELKKWGGDFNSRPTKRPPREQQSTKASFNLIFRHGELYPVQEYTGGQIPKSSKYIDWNGDEARLKPGSGLKVDANKAEILQLLQNLPAKDVDAVSYVYGDSFETYVKFQKILAEVPTLEGGWEPVGGDGNLPFGTNGTRPANQ